jgi:hypothetical protein
MTKWEYMTLDIEYDEKKQKDWVAQFVKQPPLVGLQTIFETYGSEGWELVSMTPERQQFWAGFGVWNMATTHYRAVFKRVIGGSL